MAGACGLTTQEIFGLHNDAAPDIIDTIPEFTTEDINRASSFANTLQANKRKLISAARKYSWEEAKSIVIDAYSALDPAIGKIAQKAFDEGWILSSNIAKDNPHTMPCIPGAHPYIVTDYNESDRDDIMVLGHEMAHAIAFHLSAQNHNTLFNFVGSAFLHEHFAAFGEKLVEKEMLKRAKTPQEMAFTKMQFALRELETSGLSRAIKMEEDIYRKIAEKGDSPLTFGEINAVYESHFKDLLDPNKPADIRTLPTVWQIINNPAHTLATYPISKLASHAMFEAFERDPEHFRKAYIKAMSDGRTINANQFYESVLGNGFKVDKAFLDEQKKQSMQRIDAVKEEISKLPEPSRGDGYGGGGGGGGYSSYSSSSKPDETKKKSDDSDSLTSNLRKNWVSTLAGGAAVGAGIGLASLSAKGKSEKDGEVTNDKDKSLLFKVSAVALCAIGIGAAIYAGRGGKSAMSEQQIKDGAKGILSFVLKGNSSGLSH